MSAQRAKVYAVLAGVFLLGGVAGAGAAYAYAENRYAELVEADPDEVPEPRRMRAFARELDLTPEQQGKIREIMRGHRGERRQLAKKMFNECGDPLREHKANIDAEIRAVLTPKQQLRFDELSKLHEKRFLFGPPRHRRGGPHRRGFPGGRRGPGGPPPDEPPPEGP